MKQSEAEIRQLTVMLSSTADVDEVYSIYDNAFHNRWISKCGLLCAEGIGIFEIKNIAIDVKKRELSTYVVESLKFNVYNFNDAIMLKSWKKLFNKYKAAHPESCTQSDCYITQHHKVFYPSCAVVINNNIKYIKLNSTNHLTYFGIEIDKYGRYIQIELYF